MGKVSTIGVDIANTVFQIHGVDIKIVNTAQDRFYNTELDKALKAKGITTIVIVGWKVSGSVTYTSVGAMVRDYTVVVPVDTTTAASD